MIIGDIFRTQTKQHKNPEGEQVANVLRSASALRKPMAYRSGESPPNMVSYSQSQQRVSGRTIVG